MGLRFQTVKSRVIIMMVLYAFMITLLISVFSFYLVFSFHRRTVIQSAEFNLQLVSSVINDDLLDLTAIGNWCGNNNPYIAAYFTAAANEKPIAITAYNRIQEELRNDSSRAYIRRLIITNTKRDRILQITAHYGDSKPVTIYTIDQLDSYLEPELRLEWGHVTSDPYHYCPDANVIPFVRPLTNPNDSGTIGTVYLSVDSTVITDKLEGYHLPEGSDLYLSLGANRYRIRGADFLPEPAEYEVLKNYSDLAVSPGTSVLSVKNPGAANQILISCPVRSGIVLTQSISSSELMPHRTAWTGLLLILCLMILALSVLITFSLDRQISRPVARLSKKITEISRGDFSAVPELESDSEIGMVGKGINQLSRDVVTLMDNRLADEKHKRDLEYRMLQSQINPHFLYNTLNSIKWMAQIQGVDGIAELTTALSRLLKSISKDIRRVVPLREELALLDDYIIIQKYRYSNSIELEKQIASEELLDAMIPRFTLQPIVENAIFHGIEPKGQGTIMIELLREGDDVLCTVTDDGIGMDEAKIREVLSGSSGESSFFEKIGIHNVDERIKLAFGSAYGLAIESFAGSFTTMTIRLPLKACDDK